MHVQLFDDFQRVCPQTGKATEAASLPMGNGVSLSAGRGEFVAFQVVLPADLGKSASVRPSDLAGQAGTISARQFDLFVEWYVPSAGTLPRGAKPDLIEKAPRQWIPDGLLPLDLFGKKVPLGIPDNKVPGQKFQAVWVDLFVPKDAAAGRYEGKLTIETPGESMDVPVALDVLGFTCPDKLAMPFLMNNYADSIGSGWADLRGRLDRHSTPRYKRIEQSFWQVAHDHRSVFYYLPYTHSGYVFPTFAPPLAGGGPNKKVTSWSEWDRHFGPYFDGSAFKSTRRGAIPVPRFFLPISVNWPADFLKYGRPGYADEFKAVCGQMADHFKKRGWFKTDFDMFLNHKQRFKLYPWDCEEVRFLEDNDVHRYFRTLWQGTLDHATTKPVRFNYSNGTTWTFGLDIHSDLAEFTDLWIGGSTGPAWYPERVTELKGQGQEFCSCTGGCNLSLSMRSICWWPLKFWMTNLDSFMLWMSLGWGDDPWFAPPDDGGTLLMYPGDRFGLDTALPSMRLKAIRGTLQTVERLAAAAGRVGKDPIKAKVNEVMGCTSTDWFAPKPDYVDRKLPKDWTRADFATEEPPAVGWQDKTSEQFKKLGKVAGEMII